MLSLSGSLIGVRSWQSNYSVCFRRDLSLGDLNRDADRLSVLLFQTGEQLDSMLDKAAVAEFFRVLSRECRRLAEEEIELAERNGNAQSNGNPG